MSAGVVEVLTHQTHHHQTQKSWKKKLKKFEVSLRIHLSTAPYMHMLIARHYALCTVAGSAYARAETHTACNMA